MKIKKLSVLMIALLACFASASYGTIYPFEVFTSNGSYYNNTGLDLYMDVGNGGSVADFTFYNNSTVQSSITAIYFDDGTILGATQAIINGPGTLFAEDGPKNLPSGSSIGFNADREFNIGAEPPPPENGVNNIGVGEWVTIEFQLVGGTLQDVLDELDSGAFRVGIHVQDFLDGSSESAVNIPEPTTVLLLGVGGLALLRKRR